MARWSEAVRALLEERGMTHAELARLAGIHPDTVGHVVHGGHCSTETLEKVAAALEVDLGELFGAPMDERTAALKRDRIVGAVLRELSAAVSASVVQELGDRQKRLAGRKRAAEAKLPFADAAKDRPDPA
jgi:transcriptional regulator with XRE-family HTH domain